MKKRLIFLFIMLCLANTLWPLNSGWCSDAGAKPVMIPPIWEIVLIGLQPINSLDPAKYPAERQTCIRKYLDIVPPDSYLWNFDLPSGPEDAKPIRCRVLIEQMVVVLGREVRNEAEAFAYAVPLVSEWEGLSQGPLQEADFIEVWLKEHPGTKIAPFLYLLQANRLRAGYEAARARQEEELWPILAKRYRNALNEARFHSNPLISCIAEDLEAQPYVYLEGYGKP